MVTGVTSSTMTANAVGTNSVHVTLKDNATVRSDRRSNKPIMEKRRRARINNCLNELKTLILDATKKDPARHSKLEKADILEKTVKHLQELQRQQTVIKQAADSKVINKFKAGFTECANEVSRFPGLEPAIKRRLLQHLSGCINSVKTDLQQQQRQITVIQAQQLHAHMLPSPPSSPEQESRQQQQYAVAQTMETTTIAHAQIQYTPNGYFLPNGQQVIPTKLPNNNIAFILPQKQQQQQQSQQQFMLNIPTRTSSTSSASSQSSLTYEHTYSGSPACSLATYAPPSPANSYETMDFKPLSSTHVLALAHHQQQQQQQQQHNIMLQQQKLQQQQQQMVQQDQEPLSLVVKKCIKEEDQPWRPW